MRTFSRPIAVIPNERDSGNDESKNLSIFAIPFRVVPFSNATWVPFQVVATPMLMNRRFVTDARLSENLNISRRTLQDYRDRGLIPFYRLDGKILYDEADIDRFLSERYRPKYED